MPRKFGSAWGAEWLRFPPPNHAEGKNTNIKLNLCQVHSYAQPRQSGHVERRQWQRTRRGEASPVEEEYHSYAG